MEVLMNFQILALPRDEFAPLFALADAQLQARGGKRCIDKIEGMSEHDAAKIKQASGLPLICVGG